MTQEIQISTVMLCYNRVDLSKKCLEAYLDTIAVPYELIILNNASTDGTKAWLDGIQGDKRITEIIHFEKNDPAYALNYGLQKCSGKYLHVLENDYFLLDGWDKYVIDRFARIPELGQLGISTGSKRSHGEYYQNLVVLSRINVISSSIIPKDIFIRHKIRWKNTARGYMPADATFSSEIKKIGLFVAMPDRPLAIGVGFSKSELMRDPDYYIRDYKLKLLSSLRLRPLVKNITKCRIDPNLKDAIAKLIMLYGSKRRSRDNLKNSRK